MCKNSIIMGIKSLVVRRAETMCAEWAQKSENVSVHVLQNFFQLRIIVIFVLRCFHFHLVFFLFLLERLIALRLDFQRFGGGLSDLNLNRSRVENRRQRKSHATKPMIVWVQARHRRVLVLIPIPNQHHQHRPSFVNHIRIKWNHRYRHSGECKTEL